MADIAMCRDRRCPSREHCYRYRAPVNPYRQAYMNMNRGNRDRCESYCTIAGYREEDLQPLEKIEDDHDD